MGELPSGLFTPIWDIFVRSAHYFNQSGNITRHSGQNCHGILHTLFNRTNGTVEQLHFGLERG
jgi:hypothetical protein